MVKPIFKDVAQKEIEIQLGDMEKDGSEEINVYIISNDKMVTERKRDRLIDLVMEISAEYGDVILVTAIDDVSISLAPSDPARGPAPFKIFFQEKGTIEATASKDEHVDRFLKKLFIQIQKHTSDLYEIFSYHDHAGYQKDGIFALNSDNDAPKPEERECISLEDFDKKSFAKRVQKEDEKGK